ncbi:MAG: hypothetical protein ACI8RN_002595 [Glaciecola sp.]|jgi:hypothetical protein|uniref:REDY-like protein HapK n=1 Tax=Congregibacter sp. TaxID=2744308 RepID=UPI0039E4E343
MTAIIVLFNLKESVTRADYEEWAMSTDLPVVRDLASVDDYQVFRSSGLLGSDDPAPFEYVEVISINDGDLFTQDIGSELMQKVAQQFQSFADAPQFLMTHALGSISE